MASGSQYEPNKLLDTRAGLSETLSLSKEEPRVVPSTTDIPQWREVMMLILLSVVFASLQLNTLQALISDGPTAINTLVDVSLLVLLSITVIGAIYEILQLRVD